MIVGSTHSGYPGSCWLSQTSLGLPGLPMKKHRWLNQPSAVWSRPACTLASSGSQKTASWGVETWWAGVANYQRLRLLIWRTGSLPMIQKIGTVGEHANSSTNLVKHGWRLVVVSNGLDVKMAADGKRSMTMNMAFNGWYMLTRTSQHG